MAGSNLAFLLNAIALGVYAYSVYFMCYDTNLKKMRHLIPEKLQVYGQLKFLTFQCLLIQVLNALLHLGAYFSRALEKPRDLVFTCLAYPVGSVVVYSFWAVWHLMGREFIFPAELSKYYPDWLNHSTHTIIAPLNILMAFLVNHKYSKNGGALTLFYMACYTAFLILIKAQSGFFVYRYLEEMNDIQRAIYFSFTGLMAYMMYKSGQLLTNLVYKPASQRPPIKKSKQN